MRKQATKEKGKEKAIKKNTTGFGMDSQTFLRTYQLEDIPGLASNLKQLVECALYTQESCFRMLKHDSCV